MKEASSFANFDSWQYTIDEITSTRETITQLLEDKALIDKIVEVANVCIQALQANNKIIFAGNGGSAADSQHLAAELVSRLCYNRPGIPGIAITTDTSALTAIGNDYGYELVFSRQLEAIGQEGDIFIALSTSGNSSNILKAIEVAQRKKMKVVGFTGRNGGAMANICDHILRIPSNLTPKIQECHIMLGHIICAIIEEQIYGSDYNPKYNPTLLEA